MVHNLKMYCECLYTVKQNIRNFSGSATLLSKNNKNHYDSLGLTSKATQADVKSAYYKLSMRYHPDKNKGSEEASKQFRDISEAYEVLGNVKLRRMYDKGLYTDGTAASPPPHYPQDQKMEFYKSRERRTRPPPPDGRTPIYDFDEWSRRHYGATFARKMRERETIRNYAVAKEAYNTRLKQEGFFFMLFLVMGFTIFLIASYEDYDEPKPINKPTTV